MISLYYELPDHARQRVDRIIHAAYVKHHGRQKLQGEQNPLADRLVSDPRSTQDGGG